MKKDGKLHDHLPPVNQVPTALEIKARRKDIQRVLALAGQMERGELPTQRKKWTSTTLPRWHLLPNDVPIHLPFLHGNEKRKRRRRWRRETPDDPAQPTPDPRLGDTDKNTKENKDKSPAPGTPEKEKGRERAEQRQEKISDKERRATGEKRCDENNAKHREQREQAKRPDKSSEPPLTGKVGDDWLRDLLHKPTPESMNGNAGQGPEMRGQDRGCDSFREKNPETNSVDKGPQDKQKSEASNSDKKMDTPNDGPEEGPDERHHKRHRG